MLESLVAEFLITILGPASILGTEGALGVFIFVVLIVLACLVTARIFWRRWPDTEWFAVPLLAAVVVWGASGWLLAFIATV
jgi:hypothetical protein